MGKKPSDPKIVSRETPHLMLSTPSNLDPCFDSRFLRRMEQYVDLLQRWRYVTNLVSASSFQHVWTRHILDCAQLRSYAPTASVWVDMGSGAGFPGLIIAAQLADTPCTLVHCIESDNRKCAFLRNVVRELKLPAIIHAKRVEDVRTSELGHVDAITARAMASLPRLLQYAIPFFAHDTVAIFPRGQFGEETLNSSDEKEFKIDRFPNTVDPRAYILRICRNL